MNVLDIGRLTRLAGPENIALEIVLPDVKRARIRSYLKGNAHGRKSSVEIEAPLGHGGVEVHPDTTLHGAAQLLRPSILKKCDGSQEAGNSQDDDVPKKYGTPRSLPDSAFMPTVE